jgi:hypothetical protein
MWRYGNDYYEILFPKEKFKGEFTEASREFLLVHESELTEKEPLSQ